MGDAFLRTWAESGSKMKSFVVIFLFAFLAGIHGNEFEELSLANDGDPDRHPYVVRMGPPPKVYLKIFFSLFLQAREKDICSKCSLKSYNPAEKYLCGNY